jgi:hypothetical protein
VAESEYVASEGEVVHTASDYRTVSLALIQRRQGESSRLELEVVRGVDADGSGSEGPDGEGASLQWVYYKRRSRQLLVRAGKHVATDQEREPCCRCAS